MMCPTRYLRGLMATAWTSWRSGCHIYERNGRHEEEARQIREEGWASRPIPPVRSYGDVLAFDRRQTGERNSQIFPESNPLRSVGHCCIPGCAFPSMQLLHRCTRCSESGSYTCHVQSLSTIWLRMSGILAMTVYQRQWHKAQHSLVE